MNLNPNKKHPQASPSLPNSTFRSPTNMPFQNTPVYAFMDPYTGQPSPLYTGAASPIYSSAVPMMLPQPFPATPSFLMYGSNEPYVPIEQMEELPPGMQSPVRSEKPSPIKRPAFQSLPSFEKDLIRRKESQASSRRSHDLRRQRTDRTEEFLQRRYSHPPRHMRRDKSLRDTMLQRTDSVLKRGASEKSMTTLQMMKPAQPPNIVAMALDKDLSLQLQRMIAQAKAYRDFRTIEILFLQLLPEVVRLSKDPYANFVIQRIIEAANQGLVDQMSEYVKFSVLDMATHKYACRILQRIVIYSSTAKREELVQSIMNESIELLQNKFGSYVLQTVIENTNSSVLENLTKTHLEPGFYELAIDQFGSHIMQHVFRFYNTKDKEALTELVLERVIDLSNDIHGNYVVQKMVYYGNGEIRTRVIEKVLPYIASLCCTKSGSNVLEKCLQNATREESQSIVDKVVENEETLQKIISDKYGNYVVQRMLKTLPYEQRIAFSKTLMEYFDKLEEIPQPNSFENFVYRTVINVKQKFRGRYLDSKLSGS